MPNRPALWTSVFSAVISLVALGLSMYANHISSKAYDLSRQAFISERKVTVKSQKQKEYLVLRTLEESQGINHITIYFPSTFHIDPMIITSDDMKISEAAINMNIRKYVDSTVKPKKDSIQYIYNYSIPTLFVILGHTKGISTRTYAVYDLVHEYIRPQSGESKLSLKSAVLNCYLDNAVDEPQLFIDSLFADIERPSHTK